jgi:isopenicillin N synthase-like dioxygenase
MDGINGKGSNLWSKESDLHGFFDGVNAYYSQVKPLFPHPPKQALQLSCHLASLFAISLSLPKTYFEPLMTHPGCLGRLLSYPPSKDPKPLSNSGEEYALGLGAHSDYDCLLFSCIHRAQDWKFSLLMGDGLALSQ